MKAFRCTVWSAWFAALLAWNGLAQSSPLTGTAQVAFSIVDRGGTSLSTDGPGGNVAVGYATIQANSGSTISAGVAILGFQINGTLVSEVGVPVSPLIRTGRIYAEVSGPLSTGLAIANRLENYDVGIRP